MPKTNKCPSSSSEESSSTSCKSKESFDHNLQLQLFDVYGVPVPNTQFWITVTILKEGSKVTLQLPTINWQSGPFANAPYEPPNSNPNGVPGTFPPFNAGYLYTVDGFLPKEVRPNDIENRSWLVASNNGMSQPFSFTVTPAPPYANIPAGYILQVTNFGGLVVQTAGTFGNSAPVGPQVVLPTTVSYIVRPKIKLGNNTKITPAPTNVTQFTGAFANSAYRDFHTNDAFDGIVAWAWNDNSNQVDKSNNIINLMVTTGKIDKHGKLKTRKPVQLTNLPVGFLLFDSGVAINRHNPDNIVVTYSIGNLFGAKETGVYGTICRAVSFDGGKTWPAPFDGTNSLPLNGATNVQPTGYLAPGIKAGSGDGIRCQSDKYGNIWCCATNFFDDNFNFIDQPFFMVSTDKGVSYQLVYTAPYPDIANGFFYDFPQFCFGGDGLGKYGLWFRVDYLTTATGDAYFDVGFFPITGPGQYDASATTFAQLKAFTNNLQLGPITASADGRVWIFGYTTGFGSSLMPAPMSSITSMRLTFKSPGAIDSNYAGPWDFNIANYANDILESGQDLSYPGADYFNSVQTNIYDDKRQALYQTSIGHAPDLGQGMRLYFAISRDNGQTWSQPIDISNSDIGNRGFQSMALDVIKGDLYFGWYDGRENPEAGDINYYGAVITAKELDEMVNKIPLSNPLYTVPPATTPPVVVKSIVAKDKLQIKRKSRFPIPKKP